MLDESKLIRLINILENKIDINKKFIQDLVNNYCQYKKYEPNNKYVLYLDKVINDTAKYYHKLLYAYINTSNKYIEDVFQRRIFNELDNVRYILLILYNNLHSDYINNLILNAYKGDLIGLFVKNYFSKDEYYIYKDRFDPKNAYYTTWKNGYKKPKYHLMTQDNNEIINNFKNNPDDPFNKGEYGELCAYDYLKKTHSGSNIIWVSKENGDGYGFDILRFDNSLKNANLIEIKPTTNRYKFNNYDFELTDNEMNVMDEAFETPNTIYTVYGVYLDKKTGAYIPKIVPYDKLIPKKVK